jgi:hypothetical protein
LDVVRFDNAPHHKDLESFPHHVHVGDEVQESELGRDMKENLRKVLHVLEERLTER